MALLKCRMCGGTLDIDKEQNLAVCPYCGSKSTLFERDQKLYEQFRTAFAALLDGRDGEERKPEGFWVEASREEFVRDDGRTVEVAWLFCDKTDLCTMYVAAKHVIFIFEKKDAACAERYLHMIREIKYPDRKMEGELNRFVPQEMACFTLADGRLFLAIHKEPGVYPLRLLTPLLDRHAAWVVSRLENLCCLLAASGLVHNGITVDNLFVDPAAHQIYLYGGWWFTGYENSTLPGMSADVRKSVPRRCYEAGRCRGICDLYSLRMAAARLMGGADPEDAVRKLPVPKPFARFLTQKPAPDAISDFALWDRALLAAYGERRFIPLSVTEQEVYGASISADIK